MGKGGVGKEKGKGGVVQAEGQGDRGRWGRREKTVKCCLQQHSYFSINMYWYKKSTSCPLPNAYVMLPLTTH